MGHSPTHLLSLPHGARHLLSLPVWSASRSPASGQDLDTSKSPGAGLFPIMCASPSIIWGLWGVACGG